MLRITYHGFVNFDVRRGEVVSRTMRRTERRRFPAEVVAITLPPHAHDGNRLVTDVRSITIAVAVATAARAEEFVPP